MPDPVVIVGAGWAGLAAGVELARHGAPVVLLESSPQAGGRARSIRLGAHRVDNGQHLFLGAYHALLEQMRTIGVEETRVFRRLPLSLYMRHFDGSDFRLRVPKLPAPLHLLIALCAARGITISEKWQAAKRATALLRWRSDSDISVDALLDRCGQPRALGDRLWRPLCLAALNTPSREASAAVFVRVLNAAFEGGGAADLLLPAVDLDQIFPQPATRYIQAHDDEVRFAHRVTDVIVADNVVRGVRAKSRWFDAAQVILAAPPRAAARLVAPVAGLADLARVLNGFDVEPICTIYLQYPPDTRMRAPFAGLLGGVTQWLFDRRHTGQPGLMAAVISAGGPHMSMNNASLIDAVTAELAAQFPTWPPPEQARVVREHEATFRCSAGINARRPGHHTPVDGLWLAGDYTATGLPGTLEGAVRSGHACAQLVLERMKS